jgi:hypothetical protein
VRLLRVPAVTEETELDTRVRTDELITLLQWHQTLSREQAHNLALLLRRYRKTYFGSALTDSERREGGSEMEP